MRHKSITIVLVGIILIFPLLCSSSSTEKEIESHNIVLRYSTIIPDNIAETFLENQEARLRFVQMLLNIRIDKKIDIYLLGTLSLSAAWADIQESAIEYMIPIGSLLRPNFQGIHNMGSCHHELVHVVTGLGWPGYWSDAICEGLAVYVDFAWPSLCKKDIYLVTHQLIRDNELLSLKDLLAQSITPETSERQMENIYFASATLIDFIIETYSLSQLEQFYRISGFPYVLLEQRIIEIFGVTFTNLEREWLSYVNSK